MSDEKKTVANDVVTLTRREAAALDHAVVDSLLLAAGLMPDEIIAVRRKLRSESLAGMEGALSQMG